MTAVSPYAIPVETVIDFEDVKTPDPQLLFVSNNNEKNSEEVNDTEDQNVPKRRTIGEALRPLLASMKLFGLYCNHRSVDSGDDLDKKSRKWNANTIYGAVVATVLWINAFRMFSMFTREERFGLLLFNKLIIVTWMIQCAVSQTAFYAASFSGRLAVVFNQPLADSCARHARKFSVIYTVVAWSIIMLGSAFFAYDLFFTDGF